MPLADDGPIDQDEGRTESDDQTTAADGVVADLVEMGAPDERPRETVAAADLPPPEPLRQTLERLPELADDVVLVQYNDRAPQHLYPKLDERGYEYATKEREADVLTAIWRP